MENSVSREANCVAKERLALTALALEQFRAAHGNRYPDGLSRLTPEFLAAPLMDPFDGQPLRYRLQGKGYVLYSLGPRLKDYGGQRVAGSARDLIFAVVTWATLPLPSVMFTWPPASFTVRSDPLTVLTAPVGRFDDV